MHTVLGKYIKWDIFCNTTKILSIGTGHEFAREQLDMGKNPKFWVCVLFGLFDVWVVSAFRSRFVFSLSSVIVGFWVWLDLVSTSMHLL